MSSELHDMLSRLARDPVTPLDLSVVRRRATALRMWAVTLSVVLALGVIAGGVGGWRVIAGGDEPLPPVTTTVDCESGPFELLALYLRDDATEDEIRFLLNHVSADPRVRAVYVSERDALLEFRTQYRDEPEYWRHLPGGALPARVDLYIDEDDPKLMREVAAVGKSHPVVEDVYGVGVLGPGRRKQCEFQPDPSTARLPRPTTRQLVIAAGTEAGEEWTFAAYRATTSRERNDLGSHLCYGFWWGTEPDINCYSDAARVPPGMHGRGGGWTKADLWRLVGPNNTGSRGAFVAAVSRRVARVELRTDDPSAAFEIYDPPAELALPFRVVIAFSERGEKVEILAFDSDGHNIAGLTNRGWGQ